MIASRTPPTNQPINQLINQPNNQPLKQVFGTWSRFQTWFVYQKHSHSQLPGLLTRHWHPTQVATKFDKCEKIILESFEDILKHALFPPAIEPS